MNKCAVFWFYRSNPAQRMVVWKETGVQKLLCELGCVKMVFRKLIVLVLTPQCTIMPCPKLKFGSGPGLQIVIDGSVLIYPLLIFICRAQYMTISHANDPAPRSHWLMAQWHLHYYMHVIQSDCFHFPVCFVLKVLLTPAGSNHVLQLRRLSHDVIRKPWKRLRSNPKWLPIWRVLNRTERHYLIVHCIGSTLILP